MPPLQLPVGSTIGRDGDVAKTRVINAYPQITGNQAKAPYVLYAAPGLKRWDDDSFSGGFRGAIEKDDFTLIAVLGNEVVSFSADGSSTKIGSLIGSDRVIMTKNRANPVEIIIITGSQAFQLKDGVITQVTTGNLPPPNSATYLRGRVLYGIQDGRVFASDSEDADSINALAFEPADTRADGLVRVFEHSGFAYVFGRTSIEIFAPDPSLAGEPFPFSPVQQNIAIGCAGKHTIVEGSRGLIWVDDKSFVRFGRDGGAQPISNVTVERAIEALSVDERADLVGMSYTFEGHEIYALKSALWTYEFDFHVASKFGVENAWRERQSLDSATWQVEGINRFAGKEIAGRSADGNLYEIDPQTFDEAGDEIKMELWLPYSHRFPRSAIIDQLKLDAITGVGKISGGLDVTDPVVMIDYSDDGGKTFEGEEQASLGGIGEYRTEIETYQWGLMGSQGRIWRLRASASVLRGFIQAHIEARPAA